jgi:O-antigen ligase
LYDYTHNDYLQAFAEGGLPFVVLLVANAVLFVLLLALARVGSWGLGSSRLAVWRVVA